MDSKAIGHGRWSTLIRKTKKMPQPGDRVRLVGSGWLLLDESEEGIIAVVRSLENYSSLNSGNRSFGNRFAEIEILDVSPVENINVDWGLEVGTRTSYWLQNLEVIDD